jgi:hypothetical protein
MMVAALLYYMKFVKSLTKQGFELNPYDACVANKRVNGKQITNFFHVNDCKMSHKLSKVVDATVKWLQTKYESIFEDDSRAMKVHRGKTHTILGVSLNFSEKGQRCVTMLDYLDGILKAFDLAMKEHGDGYLTVGKQRSKTSAAPDNLFLVNEECEKLSNVAAAVFHTVVAKTLYVT